MSKICQVKEVNLSGKYQGIEPEPMGEGLEPGKGSLLSSLRHLLQGDVPAATPPVTVRFGS